MSIKVRLYRLTPLSTIFQVDRGGQFYWWRAVLLDICNYKICSNAYHKILNITEVRY